MDEEKLEEAFTKLIGVKKFSYGSIGAGAFLRSRVLVQLREGSINFQSYMWMWEM